MCLSESYEHFFLHTCLVETMRKCFGLYILVLKQLSSMFLGLKHISHCRGVTSRPKSLWFNKKSLYTPGPVYFNRKTFRTCNRDQGTLLHSFCWYS